MNDLITVPTIEDITRRKLISSSLAAALLIACGDNDDEPAPAGTQEPTIRRVDTPLGSVDVPTRPERVVAFDRRGTLAYLLDLGITPVAAMSAPTIYGSKFHPLLTGVDKVEALDWQAPDLEKVAAMRPDLIVGHQPDVEKVHAQLKSIAPTVAYAFNFSKPEETLTDLGRIFGLETKAAELRSAFQADITKAKAGLKNPGTVSLILPLADQLRLYDERNLTGEIIKGLGGTIVPDIRPLVQTAGDDIAHVSYEQTNLVTGDTIVVFVNLSSDYQAIREKLLSNPLFQQLPAVKAGRVIEVESQANFGTAGLKGQRQILDTLKKAFA